MAKRVTVLDLALAAEADVDEVLVTLWDSGFDAVDSPDDVIPTDTLRAVRRILGITTPKEETRIDFWTRRTGLSREAIAEILAEMGVSLSPRSRVLPKGGLRKLRRHFDVSPTIEGLGRSSADVPSVAPAPFEWEVIGAQRELSYLSEEQVIDIHEALVRDFAGADDPIEPPGVRSADLLASALYRPMTSLGGEQKYPTVEMAAAALLHSLVLNHPFHNGNKRTGIVSMLVFLDRNGTMPTCDERELFQFVLRVAQHSIVPGATDRLADREVLAMSRWIRRNSRPIEKGERPIPWHRLRRILRGLGCESEVSPGVGNRINIVRKIERRGAFGRSREELLSTQVHYGDEGRVVERNALHKIRTDLKLDEEHGYDSKVFYEAEALPDDFIQQYRTLLRRLARL